MEYVYAAMLLHKAGQKVDEAGLNKVLEAAGAKTEPAQAKALVAALAGVDMDKAIEEASKVQAVAAPAAAAAGAEAGGGQNAAKKAEESKKKEEDAKKGEEQAAAGLSALFG